MVEAIIDERRPKTQEKGNEMARARVPKTETWYARNHRVRHISSLDKTHLEKTRK